MLHRGQRLPGRRGSALIETVLVVQVFLMFLFGTFEYCRYILMVQLTTNAAREGARYIVVNSNDTNLSTDATTTVNTAMCGFDKKLRNYKVSLYQADSSGNAMYVSGSTTTYITPDNASFGQYIGVQIDCDYDPIVPGLLFWTSSHIKSKCVMYSEAN